MKKKIATAWLFCVSFVLAGLVTLACYRLFSIDPVAFLIVFAGVACLALTVWAIEVAL